MYIKSASGSKETITGGNGGVGGHGGNGGTGGKSCNVTINKTASANLTQSSGDLGKKGLGGDGGEAGEGNGSATSGNKYPGEVGAKGEDGTGA